VSLPRRILPGTTYFVTRRCIGRRFLLRPDARLSNLFVYCLALAAERHGVEVHALTVMSNHYHLVLTDVRGVLPDFMASLNRALAMSIKLLRNWDEVVWEPGVPYSAIELGGPSEILDKVAYTLLNPVTAGLVRSPERWPGVLSTLEVMTDGEFNAQRPAVWFKKTAAESLVLRLRTPPGFASPATYLHAVQSLVGGRLTLVRAELRREGRGFVGRARLRKTPVTARPSTKKQPPGRSPTFSALTRGRWLEALRRLRAFRTAYREAFTAWRNGAYDVEFPSGTWWVVRCAGACAAT
jgi:putative transposase